PVAGTLYLGSRPSTNSTPRSALSIESISPTFTPLNRTGEPGSKLPVLGRAMVTTVLPENQSTRSTPNARYAVPKTSTIPIDTRDSTELDFIEPLRSSAATQEYCLSDRRPIWGRRLQCLQY